MDIFKELDGVVSWLLPSSHWSEHFQPHLINRLAKLTLATTESESFSDTFTVVSLLFSSVHSFSSPNSYLFLGHGCGFALSDNAIILPQRKYDMSHSYYLLASRARWPDIAKSEGRKHLVTNTRISWMSSKMLAGFKKVGILP